MSVGAVARLAPACVRDLVERQAQRSPQALYALSADATQSLRFGALAQACTQVEALLRAHGLQVGDTVSLVMPNGLMTLQLLIGAMAGGFCVNPVNLLSQPEQMRYVLDHSDCRLVLVSPDWEPSVRAIVASLGRSVALRVVDPHARTFAWPPDADAATASSSALASADAPASSQQALLMYTSGTTGVPKGVMLSQSSLVANALAISAEHALGPQDRVLAVLPLYHINAFAVTMLAPLAHGGSLLMPPKFSAAQFWAQAVEGACTWINLVPTMISYLLEGAAPDRAQTGAIRFCRSASAALAPEHLRAFESRFGIGVIETMGLTETAAPSFSNPLDAAQRKPGAVGRASGCEARVIDAALAPVADGVTGELAIRGPNVMLGYYKNDDATRAAFTPDGWLRTGDLGRRDADGFFFVTGRIKELIIKGGENIAPREIDEALLRHPAVQDAAAVGIPDRHYGQEIMACVVVRNGQRVDEAALRAFCVAQLGPYKTPKLIRFVADLPRGPSGKVQRLKLLALLDPPA